MVDGIDDQGLGDVFHIGLVVDDVGSATEQLSSLLGVRWGTIERATPIIANVTGVVQVETEFALTLGGPIHIELIGRLDDSPWATSGIHHVAVWCDDIADEASRRVEHGWTHEHGKYFKALDGTRYELVPRDLYRPRLERYAAGGHFLD